MKCFLHWLSDFLSKMPAPRARQRVWQATPSGFSDPVQTLPHRCLQLSTRYPWGLLLQGFEHQIIIIFLIIHVSARGEWHRLPVFLFNCVPFFLSKSAAPTATEKASRPDKCPAGVLARDRVLIKVFVDSIPPFSASTLAHFVDSVSLAHMHARCGSVDYGVGL